MGRNCPPLRATRLEGKSNFFVDHCKYYLAIGAFCLEGLWCIAGCFLASDFVCSSETPCHCHQQTSYCAFLARECPRCLTPPPFLGWTSSRPFCWGCLLLAGSFLGWSPFEKSHSQLLQQESVCTPGTPPHHVIIDSSFSNRFLSDISR